MSLTDIIGRAKDDIEQGAAWLSKVVDEHVPALVAEAERIQSNPIVQALEGLVFPPEVEQEIVNIIKAFAAVLSKVTAPAAPAEAVAEPAAPHAPAEPDAGQPDAGQPTAG